MKVIISHDNKMISITKLLPSSNLLYKSVVANIVWVSIRSQSNNFNLNNKKNNQNHKLSEMYQEKRVAFVNAKLSRGQVKRKNSTKFCIMR